MKNDGRAGDDWTTALAKRWQYAFIQLFTALYPQFDYAGELSWFLYKRSSSGIVRSNHSERSVRPLQKHYARMAPRCSAWADG